MGKDTKIEWCDHTFNPWWGCTKVGPGCDHCYAESLDHRLGGGHWGAGTPRRTFGDKHWAEPLKWDRAARKVGKVRLVFCASMADWLDNEAPRGQRARLLQLIDQTPNLEWLLLTKRIGNLPKMVPKGWAPKNVRVGLTAVNQEEADRDIPKLLTFWNGPNFISYEPALGPVDFGEWQEHPDSRVHFTWLDRLDWIICGGESGPGARPMHPDWARSARDQCAAGGVPFFFKQWGEWTPSASLPTDQALALEGATVLPDGCVREWQDDFPEARLTDPSMAPMRRVGKRAAGHLLDGREHQEFPA